MMVVSVSARTAQCRIVASKLSWGQDLCRSLRDLPSHSGGGGCETVS